MGHETEAACLLRTGNLYPRRVGLQDGSGRLVFAGVKHSAISLYFDDDPHAHCDLEGRWQRAYRDGVHYRKALDGSVDAIERHREGANLVLRRRSLSYAEIVDLDAAIREDVLTLLDDLGADRCQTLPPPPGHGALDAEELRDILERITRWDTGALFQHREAYLKVYRNFPFLPPDAHGAVVLQTSVGKTVRSPEELEAHARSVASFLGRRLAQCRRVFLAGTDFLHRPVADAAACLDAVARVLPIGPAADRPRKPSERPVDEVQLKGIDAALDRLDSPLPDRDGWALLRERGLARITLLVPPAASPDSLATFAADRAAAGLPLNLLLPLGGGKEPEAAARAREVASLPLAKGDIVYLVDAADVGLAPAEALDADALDALRTATKSALAPLADRGVKVLSYSREKEWN
jgi:hypothetical protein